MDECDRRTCIEREERQTERVYKWMSVTGGHEREERQTERVYKWMSVTGGHV